MTTKHTPGPWRVTDWLSKDIAVASELPCINGLSAGFIVAVACKFEEAEVRYTDGALCDETAEANARLIAAAPCLLEALQVAAYAFGTISASNGATRSAEARIKAAIAKAEGRDA